MSKRIQIISVYPPRRKRIKHPTRERYSDTVRDVVFLLDGKEQRHVEIPGQNLAILRQWTRSRLDAYLNKYAEHYISRSTAMQLPDKRLSNEFLRHDLRGALKAVLSIINDTRAMIRDPEGKPLVPITFDVVRVLAEQFEQTLYKAPPTNRSVDEAAIERQQAQEKDKG